ncbi:MAG: pyridoxal phosphate-dependent aminotransferase [Deltaproteobacteria bacterium]|nr:pyridoxal phosphate-dependent aminotransferase [Deltaproteobacteria bacterium]
MTPSISSKLPNVGTTIFTVMSALANEHRAINLSQGFPDFAVPKALLDAVDRHLREGHNQYAPMAGLPALRQAIADKTRGLYQVTIDPDTEITVTSGATEAIFDAVTSVVHPGDEVILFDPAYDSYEPAVDLCGGRAIRIPLQPPSFAVDWDRVRDAITPRTRLIMLNTPHNPSGTVWSSRDMDNLAGLVRDTGILVLSDEVYEHILFDGLEHPSVLRHPELSARSFAVFSFGKTYHATGWKLGYCVAPPSMTAEFRKVHQYVTFCTSTPMQHALADFMVSAPEHWQRLPAFYQARRDRFCALLKGSRLRFVPSSGTYFQLVDYSAISDLDDMSYARKLTIESGVAAIPVSVFYKEPPAAKLLRFCFAKDESTLERAAEVLRKL